jgi:hypothetical protein
MFTLLYYFYVLILDYLFINSFSYRNGTCSVFFLITFMLGYTTSVKS